MVLNMFIFVYLVVFHLFAVSPTFENRSDCLQAKTLYEAEGVTASECFAPPLGTLQPLTEGPGVWVDGRRATEDEEREAYDLLADQYEHELDGE